MAELAIEVTGDPRMAVAQLGALKAAFERVGRTAAQVGIALAYFYERQEAEAEYQLGFVRRTLDPRVDVQCVTTNEGRCRVVVRPLGGWS